MKGRSVALAVAALLVLAGAAAGWRLTRGERFTEGFYDGERLRFNHYPLLTSADAIREGEKENFAEAELIRGRGDNVAILTQAGSVEVRLLPRSADPGRIQPACVKTAIKGEGKMV